MSSRTRAFALAPLPGSLSTPSPGTLLPVPPGGLGIAPYDTTRPLEEQVGFSLAAEDEDPPECGDGTQMPPHLLASRVPEMPPDELAKAVKEARKEAEERMAALLEEARGEDGVVDWSRLSQPGGSWYEQSQQFELRREKREKKEYLDRLVENEEGRRASTSSSRPPRASPSTSQSRRQSTGTGADSTSARAAAAAAALSRNDEERAKKRPESLKHLMAPVSASKAKRMAEKAAKAAAKGESVSSKSSKTGSKASTPLTSNSANGSTDDLSSMAKLKLATDRSGSGVLASDPQSRDIQIESYSLSFHGRLLIENADFALNYGQRYGLLGENGSGKTTFLESMANRDVEIPEHIDIYLVRGEAEPSEMTALDFIVQSAKDKAARLEAQIEEMSVADNVDELALEAKYEELEALDPSTFESKAGAILAGLGFGPEMMKKATKDMSGGWRMRVSLAKALTIRPHLLLLDEPTNHLDLEAVVWLEAYLATYNQILVLTSHSQDFMDSVCTNILDLTLDRKFLTYGGNYTTYVRTKTENETNQMKAYQKQQDEIKHIKDFIASAGTYANLVKQAKSKQKIIDKMEAAGFIKPVMQPKALFFNFEEVKKLPPPIIAFNDVGFSYDGDMAHSLYKDLNFGIDMDSRIAIVGQNGTGKSTLLNLITGDLQPVRGSINRHPALKLAKYSQHSADQLPYDKSPLEYFESRFKPKFPDKDVQFWRAAIGRFGISGTHQTSPISHLSDGLRNRVVFAQLALERPDILLLDEPTNHLDMGSIDALARAIREFTGGVVIVSHDFRLISQVAEQLWEVKDKKITDLSKSDIGIQQYKKILSRNSEEQIARAKLVSKQAGKMANV
ncbi:hypothetical protein JCM8097_004591 [Rhodosporidiobolus ruineniae]